MACGDNEAGIGTMNIFQINTHSHIGGAAKVAHDLHTSFLAAGHQASLAASAKKSRIKNTERRRIFRDILSFKEV